MGKSSHWYFGTLNVFGSDVFLLNQNLPQSGETSDQSMTQTPEDGEGLQYDNGYPADSNIPVTPHEVVNELPMYRVWKRGPYLQATYSCPLCLRGYREGEYIRCMPCKHKFHRYCIDNWLLWARDACPVDGLPVRKPPDSEITCVDDAGCQRRDAQVEDETKESVEKVSNIVPNMETSSPRLPPAILENVHKPSVPVFVRRPVVIPMLRNQNNAVLHSDRTGISSAGIPSSNKGRHGTDVPVRPSTTENSCSNDNNNNRTEDSHQKSLLSCQPPIFLGKSPPQKIAWLKGKQYPLEMNKSSNTVAASRKYFGLHAREVSTQKSQDSRTPTGGTIRAPTLLPMIQTPHVNSRPLFKIPCRGNTRLPPLKSSNFVPPTSFKRIPDKVLPPWWQH